LIVLLADKRVDLVTCFTTLHHVPDSEAMLRELARILRPNGYLLVREHDVGDRRSQRAKYLNVLHGIMRIARVGEFAHLQAIGNDHRSWQPIKEEIMEHIRSIQYRARQDWRGQIERCGFKWAHSFEYMTDHPQVPYIDLFQLCPEKKS
jgi:ubiquinone/menaquinone biosynthesis C-methylase UbiE